MRSYLDGVRTIALQRHHFLMTALEVKHPAALPLLTVQGIKGVSREWQCKVYCVIGKVGDYKCQLSRSVAKEGILSRGIKPITYRVH